MPVRAATADDVPAVLPMVRALCDFHARRDPERFAVVEDVIDRYARWLPERAADPRSAFFVAHTPDDPTPRGFTVATIEPEVPIFWIPACAFIHDVWIDPAHRGHGLAAQLVSACVQRFRDLGVRQLRLHTAMFNDDARALFAREGFRPCVVEMLRPL